MRTGDIIAARDGQPYDRVAVSRVTHPNLEIGQDLRFEIERDGQRRQLTMTVRRVEPIGAGDVGVGLLWYAPAGVMLATAVLIGVKRPRDAVARMGALTLATLAVGLYRFNLPGGYAVAWRSAAVGPGHAPLDPQRLHRALRPDRDGVLRAVPTPTVPGAMAVGPGLASDGVHGASGPLHALPEGVPPVDGLCPARSGLDRSCKRRPVRPVRHRHGCSHCRQLPSAERLQGEAAAARPHCRWGRRRAAWPRSVRRGRVRRGSWLANFLGSGVPDLLIVVLFFLFPLSFAYAVLRHQDPRRRRHREDRRAVCARERPRPLARAASWRDPGRGRAGSRRPAPHRDRAGARVGVRDAGRPRGAGARAASPDGPRARPPVLP